MSSPMRPPRTPTRSRGRPPSRQSQQSSPGTRSSPRLNGTPRQNGTITPTNQVNGSSADTPLRWANRRTQETIAASSEGLASGSSPRRYLTSPLGQGMDLSSPLNYGTPGSVGSIQTPRSGIQGTPMRDRPDIQADRRPRQVNIGEGVPEEATSESDHAGPTVHIWGTDVEAAAVKNKFRRFIERYIDPEAENDELPESLNIAEPLYMQKLNEIHETEVPFMNVNCAHMDGFDKELCRQLIHYPQEVIPLLDMTAMEMYFEKYPDDKLEHWIQIRPYNVPRTTSMRLLNPEDIDQLITITGMVIRTSNIIPEMGEAFFRCIVCKFTTRVEVERGRINEPNVCTKCNNNFCFSLIHNRSSYHDKQLIKLQESPDDMPSGQTPTTINLFAHNDLVDTVSAGDRVAVTGVYRAIPIQVMPRASNIKAVYKVHIDVVHFRKQDSKRLYDVEEGKEHAFPPERLELLKLLSKKEDVYERLARNIAPSIYGNTDIKKGILLQLFGGTKKTHVTSGRSHYRSEINILLCGDPGTSKSQLLQFVYNLVPRSQYSSGKGSSAVGLTAYVTKDPETRQLVLQTGALVLADNGICCIDEFDKMDDSTRSVLHEVMEQQTLSIAKAGIICQLNARTSILAAANPCGSQWDQNKTIIENVKLPPTLLSRFDLIFLILDPQDDAFDRKLARHLVGLYYEHEDEEEDDLIDMSILRDYLAFAKEHISPRLSEEAQQKLIQAYVDMRRAGMGRGQITAYPRQLESLIRLSEAHAKVRLSNVVEVADVEEAWRLHREALKQAATDPETGKVDPSIITTGHSASERQKRLLFTDALKKLIKSKGNIPTLSYQQLFKEVKESTELFVNKDLFEEALRSLQNDRMITLVGRSIIKIHQQ